MKKLRANNLEREMFLNQIMERLLNNKTVIDEFSIEDLKKEYTKLPEDIVKPTIEITAEAYLKMLELVNQSATECSWHGLVSRNNNVYWIYDVLVFPQINSATATTTDEKEFAEWQTKLIMDPDFPIEDLRMHGHSHVNMNVFSSGVDDQYQKDLIAKVDDEDYYIFFIMNKKMEICIFLYDFAQQVMFETSDITFKITNLHNEDIRGWAKEQLKENATTERVFKSNKPVQRRWDDDDADYTYSYFSNSKPIFKGVSNGSK